MEVFEAISNRRSVRHQKSDPFDEEILQKILEAARWAPSWANTQCWRFIVVRDAGTKAQLAGTMFNFMKPDQPAIGPATTSVAEAPVVIVVCAELNKSGCLADGTPASDKGGNWYMFDTALATQNITLAAHALGLGTVIIGAFDAVKAAEILEVPEGYCVVALTPLGFPAQEAKAPPRKELSEIIFHDKFGA